MKTYLLDSINKFRRYSENLDAKTVICNKSWWVFNDLGEKEIYIFQEDGSLIISLNGKVTNATWKYISANRSFVINTSQQAVMVHAAFMDNMVFALQLDGTNQFAFLIDESNKENFQPKSLSEVKIYFAEKMALEEAIINASKQKQIDQINAEKQKQLEQERKRKKEEVSKRKLRIVANSIIESNEYEKWKKLRRSGLRSGVTLSVISTLIVCSPFVRTLFDFGSFSIVCFSIILIFIFFLVLYFERDDNKNYELIWRKRDKYEVVGRGNFFEFNLRGIKEAFDDFTIKTDYNETESLAMYLEGEGILDIIYKYKEEKIEVASYNLDLID